MNEDPGGQIRPAGRADIEALAALERASFAEPWSAVLLDGELSRPGSLLLVLEQGSGVAAYAAFAVGLGEAELLRLAVAPEVRRTGLASRLLRAGLAAVGEAGAVSCFLEVRADNAAALALYGHHGFEVVGRRPRYYAGGVDAVLMQLRLVDRP